MPKKTQNTAPKPEEFDPVITPTVETPEEAPKAPTQEATVPLSDVKRLIAEALAQQAQDARKPVTLKKQTEHYAHLWRFEGSWVVDFKDQNNDPYVSNKVHAFDVYNEATRSFEPHIELMFSDNKPSKKVALKSYIAKRIPVYCLIKERKKIDRSYSIGETEKKEWSESSSKMVGTGKMVDQVIERYDEVFTLETPEGEIITVNDYVIA